VVAKMESLTNAINILNININNTNEECMICKDELSCAQCYTLPECNHTYHTHCLVSWFRNGDSRCPYCGNKGINNTNNDTLRHVRGAYFTTRFETQMLADIKKYIFLKKNDTNNRCLETRKHFDKIKVLEENYKIETQKLRELQQSLKETPAIYSEAKKNIMCYRSKKWKISRQIRLERLKIINNSYIIPLIIPMSVSI
jgi:hypothetical protein